MNNDDLDRILEKQSVSECVQALAGLSEKERKALSQRALQWLKVSTGHNIQDPAWSWWIALAEKMARTVSASTGVPRNVQRMIEQNEEAKKLASELPSSAVMKAAIEPAKAAVFATCALGDIKKHGGQPGDADACHEILVARKPRWAEQWARYVLDEHPEIFWPSILRLEQGQILVLEPDTDYFCAMAVGMARAKWIPEVLRNDRTLCGRIWPMLADDSVCRVLMNSTPAKWKKKDWQWFRVLNGVGEAWRKALVELAETQTISRHELLDHNMSSLTRLALESSEAASKADLRWFCDLHTAVCTSNEIEAPSAEKLARLLYSRNAPTVGWALARLKQLVQARVAVSIETLLPAIEAIFLVKGKENAVKAVELLATIAESFPEDTGAVAVAGVTAFENDSPEVQKRALALVEKFGTGHVEVSEKLKDSLDRIAVVHRQRAKEWIEKQLPSSDPHVTVASAKSGALARALTVVVDYSAAPPSASNLAETLQACDDVARHLRTCAGVESAAEAIRAGDFDVPALEFDGTEYPRLNPDKRLQIAADFDAMVFMLNKGASSGDDQERNLEAIARFGAQRPDDFEQRTAALRQKGTSWVGSDQSVMRWLSASAAGWSAAGRHPIDEMLSKRCDLVGTRARAGQAQVLLSTPTHSGGWIDPLVLVQRLINSETAAQANQTAAPDLVSLAGQMLANSASNMLKAVGLALPVPQQVDLLDQSLAISRLAPERRQEALALLTAKPAKSTEFRNALRYALGDSSVEIGPTAALWIAAARSRAPFEDDQAVEKKFPCLGPDGGRAAKYKLLTDPVRVPDPKYPHVSGFKIVDRLPEPIGNQDLIDSIASCALHVRRTVSIFNQCPFFHRDWASTVCPMLIESWFAHCVEMIAHSDGKGDAGLCRSFVEKMYDPDVPLKPMALLTISLAISAKFKEQSDPAMECLIQAIEDGRLNSTKLTGAIETARSFNTGIKQTVLSSLEFVSLTRWAKAMKTAALTSPYHALVVRGAIEQLLTGDPADAPKDLHTLLDVLLELAMQQQQPVVRAPAREYLSGIKTSGKTAKLVKQLLALKKGPDADRIHMESLTYALEKRIDRACRWQAWLDSHNEAKIGPAAELV